MIAFGSRLSAHSDEYSVADDSMTRPLAQISDSRANPQFSAGGAVPLISVATIPTQDPGSDAHLLTSADV